MVRDQQRDFFFQYFSDKILLLLLKLNVSRLYKTEKQCLLFLSTLF